MAGRIRTLKPELLDDEKGAALSDAAWRVWVSARLLADDHGNLRAGARYIGAQVWQDTTREAEAPLAELEAAGKIVRYRVEGEPFAHLVGWETEQRIDNAGKPRVPGPDLSDETENQEVTGVLAETRGEPPRVSENRRSARAHRRASSPLDQRSPTSDLRPPTTEDAARASVALAGDPPPARNAGRSTKGTRLPDDWHPSEATLARFRADGVDALGSLEAFQNYWLAKAGANALKLDWERTFANWVKEDMVRGRSRPLEVHGGEPEWQPSLPVDGVATPDEVRQLFEGLAKTKNVDALLARGEEAGRG